MATVDLVPPEWNPIVIGVQEGAPAELLSVFLERPDQAAEVIDLPMFTQTGLLVLGWPERIEDDPQCRAITRKGTRCRNPIFYGQVHWYWLAEECYVTKDDFDALVTGMCRFHAQGERQSKSRSSSRSRRT